MPGSAEKAKLLRYHNRILSPNRSILLGILRKSKSHFGSATCDRCQIPSRIKEGDPELINIIATGSQNTIKPASF